MVDFQEITPTFKKTIDEWINSQNKTFINENKNDYIFKYCNITYFINPLPKNVAHIEYKRYLLWNKLIEKIKDFFDQNKITFKKKSIDRGIGNNMAMWVVLLVPLFSRPIYTI